MQKRCSQSTVILNLLCNENAGKKALKDGMCKAYWFKLTIENFKGQWPFTQSLCS